MLPRFPKAQKIADEAHFEKMFEATNKVFPLEIHPPVHPILEGRRSDYQREDRKIKELKIERLEVKAQLDTSSGKGTSVEQLFQIAEQLGTDLGKQKLQMLVGAIDEAVAETGQEIKIKGGRLTQESFLELLAMGQDSFDEKGSVQKQLVCGPDLAEEFKKREAEWSNDREFQAKVAAIEERKRREFYEREARRRLAP